MLWLKRTALLLALLLSTGCGAPETPAPEPDAPEADARYPQFAFTHYTSGGTPEIYTAVILFEQSVSSFTSYQVAFTSCTCRDALVNYTSICYVELLNKKPTADDSAIRAISFLDNKGLWGDSNPNYYRHDYTQEYMDEHFVQRLVRASKRDFDAWGGYGTQLACIDADAVSGASVSTSNITSMLQALFAYHAEKYYADEDS